MEGLEDVGLLFDVDAGTVVGDLETRRHRLGADPHVDGRAIGGVLHGVGEQVVDDLAQTIGVAPDSDGAGRLQADDARSGPAAGPVDRGGDDGGEVDVLELEGRSWSSRARSSRSSTSTLMRLASSRMWRIEWRGLRAGHGPRSKSSE